MYTLYTSWSVSSPNKHKRSKHAHTRPTSSDRGVLASLGVASCHIRDTPLLKARASTRGAHGGVHGFSPNPNRRVLAQPPACAASAPSRREP